MKSTASCVKLEVSVLTSTEGVITVMLRINGHGDMSAL